MSDTANLSEPALRRQRALQATTDKLLKVTQWMAADTALEALQKAYAAEQRRYRQKILDHHKRTG